MTDDLLVPVFDIGGVMFDWNPLYLYRKLFETEEEAVWFCENVCTPDWNIGLDAGADYAKAVARKCAEFPRYWREIQAFDTRWGEMNGGIIEGTVAIHDELVAAELPTFAITNFSWEKWVGSLGAFPFFEKFDGVVVSGLEGLVKPDPRIFNLFLNRYGLAAESCVMIDDNAINIAAAKALGFKTVHFASPAQCRAELIAFGLPLKAKG
ncbi:MAG: HAD-IA family hydrolase [Alphaproteobacteria bacterium]|nr:HAD-IA family hydrolase [Alphaproteobacteria bacterium]